MALTNAELKARWPSGRQVIADIRSKTDTIILSFSTGKDSLAAWLLLREHFPNIIPVYKYSVPNLGFVERSLAYYERFFGTRIYRYPHPSFYRRLINLTFQAPENCAIIEAAQLPLFSHEDLMERVRQDRKLPPDTPVAVGTRACDSPQRRMAFARQGPVNEKRLSFYPVWDLNKADVVELIRKAGVLLPAEYRIFGRSMDGIDFRFLYGIRQHWPEDYQRILDFFPLASLELFRYECAMKAKGATP